MTDKRDATKTGNFIMFKGLIYEDDSTLKDSLIKLLLPQYVTRDILYKLNGNAHLASSALERQFSHPVFTPNTRGLCKEAINLCMTCFITLHSHNIKHRTFQDEMTPNRVIYGDIATCPNQKVATNLHSF